MNELVFQDREVKGLWMDGWMDGWVGGGFSIYTPQLK